MNYNDLQKNVFEWSKARGIHKESDYSAQIEKFTEELDEFKDAIGDMTVCLINALHFADSIEQREAIQFQIDKLKRVAELAGVNYEECLEMAWEAIRYRVGLMIDGKFVKWENLSHEQRIEVARSGQLEREGVNLRALADHCTKCQWEEMHEARNS